MAAIVDTHCHIDLPAFDADRRDVIDRARRAGVVGMIVIGFEPERWGPAIALSREEPGIKVALGLHPTEAERYDDALERALRDLAREVQPCAIGEIGLDYHWETASPAAQRRAFERQIALAREFGLPFIVHQRDAADDALEVLRATDPPHRGVMHCFTEDLGYAKRFLELGMTIGLGGAVTFRKARGLHEVARRVPLDRIVLETDAPYMTPSPHRGERNEPAYVRLVAEHVAELRETTVDVVAAATTRNAERLFGRFRPEGGEREGTE